jgi:hypothetical protein
MQDELQTRCVGCGCGVGTCRCAPGVRWPCAVKVSLTLAEPNVEYTGRWVAFSATIPGLADVFARPVVSIVQTTAPTCLPGHCGQYRGAVLIHRTTTTTWETRDAGDPPSNPAIPIADQDAGNGEDVGPYIPHLVGTVPADATTEEDLEALVGVAYPNGGDCESGRPAVVSVRTPGTTTASEGGDLVTRIECRSNTVLLSQRAVYPEYAHDALCAACGASFTADRNDEAPRSVYVNAGTLVADSAPAYAADVPEGTQVVRYHVVPTVESVSVEPADCPSSGLCMVVTTTAGVVRFPLSRATASYEAGAAACGYTGAHGGVTATGANPFGVGTPPLWTAHYVCNGFATYATLPPSSTCCPVGEYALTGPTQFGSTPDPSVTAIEIVADGECPTDPCPGDTCSATLHSTGEQSTSGTGCLIDPNWTVDGAPARIVPNSVNPAGNWVTPPSGTSWVAATCDALTTVIGAPHTYATTIAIPVGVDLDALRISGRFAGDDQITDVLVNGVSTGITKGTDFDVLSDFELLGSVGFTHGDNTIEFETLDNDLVYALLVVWDEVTCDA